MPARSKKSKQATAAATAGQQSASDKGVEATASESEHVLRMPMSRYLWTVGLHTSLLAFSVLFLPQSKLLQELSQFFEGEVKPLPATPLEALTERPTLTLFSLCLGTLLLQTWWSEWLRRWWIDSISTGAEEAKQLEKRFFSPDRLQPLLKVAGTLIVASIGTHVLLVLFGAHINKYVLKTYLLALLLAILAVLPATYLLGPPGFGSDNTSLVKRWTWIRMFAELSARNPIERSIIYPSVGTAVGCWLGVIPIALDWERPWQAWPLTPAYGAVLGYIIASIGALTANAIELTQDSPAPAITTASE